jgi:hypothetical protein
MVKPRVKLDTIPDLISTNWVEKFVDCPALPKCLSEIQPYNPKPTQAFHKIIVIIL